MAIVTAGRSPHGGDALDPRDAATPLALFEAPQGWHFAAGDYTFRLVADRVITGQPLTDEFTLSLAGTVSHVPDD